MSSGLCHILCDVCRYRKVIKVNHSTTKKEKPMMGEGVSNDFDLS